MQQLTLIQCGQSARLRAALKGVDPLPVEALASYGVQKLVFAVAVDACGPDRQYYELLRYLRTHPAALQGCVAAVLVDGCSELDTKQVARELIFHANRAGCCFPGKPLVEATGSLHNLKIQQQKRGLDSLEQTYLACSADLLRQLADFRMPKRSRPRILLLHASDQKTSNTLALGQMTAERLQTCCDVQTLCLRNGAVHDCRGCSYSVCAHFARQGACFYGGSIVEEVFPAVLQSDALLLLCPNYNDAPGANIMAFINRLTSLTVSNTLAGRSLFAIVVSGYSGGDIVAQQLLGALNVNKSLILPPRFCLLETANAPGEAAGLDGIGQRIDAFAENIRKALCVQA